METVELGQPVREVVPKWLWAPVMFALLLAWDASGLDLVLARLAAGSQGFELRDEWLTSVLLHQSMRQLSYVVGAWLFLGIWWPVGVLRQLSRAARVQWLVTVLLSVALINLLKQASLTSCPWDLAEFGGTASYLTHWAWGQPDGGPGHCFPAGHASAGFAFLGGFFVLRPVAPRAARWCLALVLAAGFILGFAQQLRGAHFMSHTLWTAWLCWTTAWFLDVAVRFGWDAQEGILASHGAS